MMSEDEIVERFIEYWREECENRGIDYKDVPYSNIRLLARVIAKTLIEIKRRAA